MEKCCSVNRFKSDVYKHLMEIGGLIEVVRMIKGKRRHRK